MNDNLPKPYDWHRCMMEMAATISKMSKDPSTQVGAVLVSPDKKQIIPAYNGFPRGIPDRKDWWYNRGKDESTKAEYTKYELVLHAEMNALMQVKTEVTGWTLYCTHRPCLRCTVALIQAGIHHIFYWKDVTSMDLDAKRVDALLEMAGRTIERLTLNEAPS